MIQKNENNQKVRSSNFELLRLILIFMVILGHANVWFIGSGYQTVPEHIMKVIVQVVCLPAVNAFILISGWFGINSGFHKVFAMIFQLLFCTLPIAIIMAMMGYINIFSLNGISEYVLGGANYWFVIDYIGLLLFSPVLNTIVLNSPQKILRMFLIAVLGLIVLMDFILRSNVLGLEGGYSLLWFVYLYLLARYMRIYGIKSIEKNKWKIIVLCFILQTLLLYFHLTSNRYTNPLILLPAISMILIVKDLSFKSRIVNYMATAALMAYMLHMHPCFWREIGVFLRRLYQSDGYFLYMVEVVGLIMLLYLIALAYYKLQEIFWKWISKQIFDNK